MLEQDSEYFKHLGLGDFGEVYKGNLSDGISVAIKRFFEEPDNRIEDSRKEEGPDYCVITPLEKLNVIAIDTK
ncbi:hypothetical protein VNO78_33904 [Psophocarpus tetragonolobus]|uniref:Protein kinase domain-containing protein n=1 Tax=Psophocarpus tetragonolobus TaxID=3891 RepID=A0AAN9NY12_PSOTE